MENPIIACDVSKGQSHIQGFIGLSIGHMWHFDENRMVLDTREMRLETKKMFEDIKYGW